MLRPVSESEYQAPATAFGCQPGRTRAGLGASVCLGYAQVMHELSDEQLMLRYAAGEMPAFEVLYDRHRGALYRYFVRHLGEATTANDLYQSCWEKVIGARSRYRPQAPFRAWLFRIAHNLVADHYRRRPPLTPLDESGFVGAAPGPDEALERDAQAASLRAALLSLPSEQRDALLLKLEGGFSLEDIASLSGVGRETIKSRLRYATERLRKVMQS